MSLVAFDFPRCFAPVVVRQAPSLEADAEFQKMLQVGKTWPNMGIWLVVWNIFYVP
jgi:hypothetical protein